ncbi:hypothetical protein HpBT030_10170 [Helicobacter pylori]
MEKNYLSTSLLDYKQQHNGKLLVKVPPQYTSKTCCHCGSINPKLKLNHRQYLCPDCGHKEHRDINAANNILNKGLSLFLGWEISMQTLKNKAFWVSVH